MSAENPPDPGFGLPRNRDFDLTSLTLLQKVRDGDAAALEKLCSRYWYPLYTWLLFTRRVRNEEDARDFVQGFFLKMIEREKLAAHDPAKGRFRTYLLTCLKRQVIDQWRKPGLDIVEPYGDDDDPLAQLEEVETADAAFEKAWAWDLLEAAKTKLRQNWQKTGQGELFAAFEPYLEGNRAEEGLEAIGRQFGLSHANIRQRLFRLKHQELRHILYEMVLAELPENATEVERSEEMQRFLEALLM